MGSAPSGNQQKCEVRVEENVAKVAEDLKNDSILKQIVQNVEKEPLALKPSQSVNIDRSKNQTKVKRVRDVRTFETLKDLKVPNNENQPVLGEIGGDEIEDVTMSRKPVRELNPVTKKKMASDRVMLTAQSKTQNLISMIPLNQLDPRQELKSRTKRCRVSRML